MKKTELPQLIPECRATKKQFCATCRERENGRAFRRTILEYRGLVDTVSIDFQCPIKKPWSDEITDEPGLLAKGANLVKAGARAGVSVAKTSVGIDRATEEQYQARLDVCGSCPGGHATHTKDGKLHTCGPMLKSATDAGEGTCGCVLHLKARDLAEDCPFGYWPTIEGKKV